MEVDEIVEMGTAAAATAPVSVSSKVGSAAGVLGSWTGSRFENLGSLMKRHPITSTVAVVGGLALIGYVIHRSRTLESENLELAATLNGATMVLNNLYPEIKEKKDD